MMNEPVNDFSTNSENHFVVPVDLLTGFFSAIEPDARITTAHISIYISLLYVLSQNGNENPVAVARYTLLQLSKTSRTTYQKCIKELHEFGYLKYFPSFDRTGMPVFYLFAFTLNG